MLLIASSLEDEAMQFNLTKKQWCEIVHYLIGEPYDHRVLERALDQLPPSMQKIFYEEINKQLANETNELPPRGEDSS